MIHQIAVHLGGKRLIMAMNKVVNYSSIVASIIGIIGVIIAGIKLGSNNYDIVCEGIIIGICLVVLFISAVIKISKQSK